MSPDDNANVAVEAGAPAPRERAGGPDATREALLQEVAQRARTPLIIERPEGILTARRLTNYALTFLWWGVWGHFMLPLVTLLLWMSGFRRFSEELLGRGGLNALVSRLPVYGAVVAALCGGLIAWALLNWWRFAERERRRFARPVAPAQIAHSYGLEPAQLARWQAQRRLVVVHDAEGRPTGLMAPPEPAHPPH